MGLSARSSTLEHGTSAWDSHKKTSKASIMQLKRISLTVWLLAILVLLGTAYAISLLVDNKGRSEEFSQELVSGKAENITQLLLIQPSDSIRLVKDSVWWVRLRHAGVLQSFPTDSGSVEDVLSSLYEIKPDRIHSKDSAQWADLSLDSTGMRVQAFENDSKRVDLLFGKSTKDRRRLTYIRQANSAITYIMENLSSALLYPTSRYFRDKTITATDTAFLESVTFSYRIDTGAWSVPPAYELVRDINNNWTIEGAGVNEVALKRFLNFSINLAGSFFAEPNEITIPEVPTCRMQVRENNGFTYEVVAWREESLDSWIVQSSLNTSAYFIGNSNWEYIFRPKSYFFSPPE